MKIATTEINMGSQQGWYRMGQEVLLVAGLLDIGCSVYWPLLPGYCLAAYIASH